MDFLQRLTRPLAAAALTVFAEVFAGVAFLALLAWTFVAPLLLALAALLAAWVAYRALPPAPELHHQDFALRQGADTAFEVSPQAALELPFPFADFDLHTDLQLDPGAVVDVVLRRVEPRQRAAGLEPFHGRFAVVRLSTRGAGEATLGRDAALFRSDPTHGHALVPDQPVTVSVRARGRTLHVNVGGVDHPPLCAADAHGGVAIVARGAAAHVNHLTIAARPRPLQPLPTTWAALLAGLAGLLFVGRRQPPLARLALAALALPACGWLAGAAVLGHLAPESEPSTTGAVLAALTGLPLALLLAAGGRRGWLVRAVSGLALGLLALEGVARSEAPRLQPLQNPALDAAFGPLSGEAPFDALARRTRSPGRVYSPPQPATDGVAEPVVLFLGGALLWEDAAWPAERWTARLATERAARRLPAATPRPVVVGSPWGHVRQQVLLAERFLLDAFRPELVVLGVGDWEGEAAESPRVRRALDTWFAAGPEAAATPAVGWSRLLDLWRAAAATRRAVAPGDAETVPAAVERLHARCAERGAELAVVVARGVPEPIEKALRDVCAAAELRYAAGVAFGAAELEPVIEQLAELLVDELADREGR